MEGQLIEIGKPFTVKFTKPILNPLNQWRVFSQKGLSVGVSSSPQYPGLSILGSTATDPEQLQKDFGCCCNPCREVFTDLYFDINAYHLCNRAHFDLYVLDYQATNDSDGGLFYIWIGHANVNSAKDNLQNSPNNGNAPTINDYDYFMVPESTLAIANAGKTAEQCCEMQFILWPSPFPSRLFLTDEYIRVTNDDFSYPIQGEMYIKSVGNVTLDQREFESVHTNIAYATVKTPADDDVNTCDFVGRIPRLNQGPSQGEKTPDGCCVLLGEANLNPGSAVSLNLCGGCVGCKTHKEVFGSSESLSVRWGFQHTVRSNRGDILFPHDILPQFDSGLIGPLESPSHTIDVGKHRYEYSMSATIQQSHLRIVCAVSPNQAPNFRTTPGQILIAFSEYACQTYNTLTFNGERTNANNTLVVQNQHSPVAGGETRWEFVGARLHGQRVPASVFRPAATNNSVWYQVPGAYAKESTLIGYPGAFPYSANMNVRHSDATGRGAAQWETFFVDFTVIIYDVYITSTGRSVGLYHVGPTSPGTIRPTVLVGH